MDTTRTSEHETKHDPLNHGSFSVLSVLRERLIVSYLFCNPGQFISPDYASSVYEEGR